MTEHDFAELVSAWRRYRVLADAFGVDLDVPPAGMEIVHRFALEANAAAAAPGSPFDNLLEAPEPIHRLYERHASRIRESEGDAKVAAVHALVLDAFEMLYPKAAGRSVDVEGLAT